MRPAALITGLLLALANAASAQAKWRLVEDLRIGSGDEGPTSFNDIRDFDVDGRGRVVILEYQSQEVRLFGADGKFVRQVGRRGQGPGEYSQPNGVRFGRGGSIWVNDHRNSRFVSFTPEGASATQPLMPRWGWGFRWDAAVDSAGRITESFSSRAPGATESTPMLRRFDPAGGTLDTLAIPACLASSGEYRDYSVTWKNGTSSGVFGIPFAPMPVRRLDAFGGYACARGDQYRAQVVRVPDGRIVTDITSQSAPLTIPNTERDSAIAGVYQTSSPIPPGTLDPSRVPRTYPRIDQIYSDDQGRVWLLRKAASGMVFDVWSRNGRQIATIDSPFPFARFSAVLIRGDHLYGVITDSDGVPAVARYRIAR